MIFFIYVFHTDCYKTTPNSRLCTLLLQLLTKSVVNNFVWMTAQFKLTLSISSSQLVLISTFIGMSGNASKTLSSNGIWQSSFFTLHLTPVRRIKTSLRPQYFKQHYFNRSRLDPVNYFSKGGGMREARGELLFLPRERNEARCVPLLLYGM